MPKQTRLEQIRDGHFSQRELTGYFNAPDVETREAAFKILTEERGALSPLVREWLLKMGEQQGAPGEIAQRAFNKDRTTYAQPEFVWVPRDITFAANDTPYHSNTYKRSRPYLDNTSLLGLGL